MTPAMPNTGVDGAPRAHRSSAGVKTLGIFLSALPDTAEMRRRDALLGDTARVLGVFRKVAWGDAGRLPFTH